MCRTSLTLATQAACRAPRATDPLVAVDRHDDRPAKPSSGLLERL